MPPSRVGIRAKPFFGELYGKHVRKVHDRPPPYHRRGRWEKRGEGRKKALSLREPKNEAGLL